MWYLLGLSFVWPEGLVIVLKVFGGVFGFGGLCWLSVKISRWWALRKAFNAQMQRVPAPSYKQVVSIPSYEMQKLKALGWEPDKRRMGVKKRRDCVDVSWDVRDRGSVMCILDLDMLALTYRGVIPKTAQQMNRI